ncbi:MAG: hypothetical protein IAI50_20380, partial [Candidatus Eremiobacteraeota bacterium]|nr:hypothetical protein [Candidatus Eremiobacteraeota bacterium]
MKDFERRATLASIAVVVLVVAFGGEAITAETIGDTTVETRAYSGTREIRHTVDVGSTASSEEYYHGVFDVEASRTDKRSGNTVFETETRSFTVRSGGYRINAAMREVIVRDEHVVSGSSDVMLDESALDRATFGYLAPEPVNGVRGYAPFDGIDREWIVEKYDEPPLADTLRPGVYANSAARSTETSISHVRGETNSGSISEVISPDGTVRGGGTDTPVEESFEQHADGSGRSTSSAPGFYNVDLQIAAAAPEPA